MPPYRYLHTNYLFIILGNKDIYFDIEIYGFFAYTLGVLYQSFKKNNESYKNYKNVHKYNPCLIHYNVIVQSTIF